MQRFEGTVKKYRIISRWQVQIELKELQGVFELYVSQVWALDVGDSIILAGDRTETGIIECLAYRNKTKQIKGWTEPQRLSGIGCVLIIFGLIFSTVSSLFLSRFYDRLPARIIVLVLCIVGLAIIFIGFLSILKSFFEKLKFTKVLKLVDGE
jgi:hypothetical protein